MRSNYRITRYQNTGLTCTYVSLCIKCVPLVTSFACVTRKYRCVCVFIFLLDFVFITCRKKMLNCHVGRAQLRQLRSKGHLKNGE